MPGRDGANRSRPAGRCRWLKRDRESYRHGDRQAAASSLRKARVETYVEDVLDVFWLAKHLEGQTLYQPAHTPERSVPLPPAPPEAKHNEPTQQGSPVSKVSQGCPPYRETPVFPVGKTEWSKASVLSVAAARALPNRLALARSMRPFTRRWRSIQEQEVDEEATVDAAALGFLHPVLRPAPERWYSVDLVIEDDAAVNVLRPTLREFCQLLRNTGAFQDVRQWQLRLGPREGASTEFAAMLESPEGARVSPQLVAGTGIRRLVLFATHGSSIHWVDGTYKQVLERWLPTATVALLHLRSKGQWERTPLGSARGICHTARPGVATLLLDAQPFWWMSLAGDGTPFVPIVALESGDLARFADMQMGRGRSAPIVFLDSSRADREDLWAGAPAIDVARIIAGLREESPDSFRLAVYLCSTPFTLPVARLIQEVKFGPDAPQSVLADVLLSGLIVTRSPSLHHDPDMVYYDFRPEAREILIRSLRWADAVSLAQEVSRHINAISDRSAKYEARGQRPASLSISPGPPTGPSSDFDEIIEQAPEEDHVPGDIAPSEAMHLVVEWAEWTPRSIRSLALNEGFEVRRSYVVTVALSDVSDPRYGGAGPDPTVKRPSKADDIVLQVVMIPRSSHIKVDGPQIGEFAWPHRGETTGCARFLLVAERPGDAVVDVLMYHQCNVIYIAQCSVRVIDEGTPWAHSGRPIRWLHRQDVDGARSDLFRGYAAVNGLPSKAASIVVQRSDRGDFILTLLIGRAEFPVRVRMKGEELADRLVKVRKRLDRLRREPTLIEGGFTEDGRYEGNIDQLHLFNRGGQRLDMGQAQRATDAFLTDMALLGARLRDDLFSSPDGAIAYRLIKEGLKPDAVIQIWIDRDASEFLFPWVWIYDDHVRPGRRVVAEWRHFWGAKYVIEQLPQFSERMLAPEPVPEIGGSAPLKLAFGPFTFIQTPDHLAFFEQCAKASRGALHYVVWRDPTEWETALAHCDRQVLYFFSHGHVAKPISGGISFYDMLGACRDWAGAAPPNESAPMREYRLRFVQILDGLANEHAPLDQTFIRLDRGYLLVSMLHATRMEVAQPLVFLNMCESAQVFPSLSDGLVDAFMRKGARGVIGTEIPMIPQFAERFGRLFFERFFYGGDASSFVGRILLDLRRTFIAAGNPLGFAYTHFGDAAVRLAQPLPGRLTERGCEAPATAGGEKPLRPEIVEEQT
jgi:hypothetical protein